ncbi:valine--tRNA ligase [Candidatus Woesearchaeota archaeon CG07_land_8_20_14_0_80_44_23]|nr:MAG: valine--tRNA ligase [Candidatus Woesearchaeota archaeon CG07_land_8_20_14_0_80_44_23]
MAPENSKEGSKEESSRFYDPHLSEPKWQEYWEKEGIGRFEPNSDRRIFSIDTPPPTVSGTMHMGHAFAYTQMDIIARYHIMKGENVFYPFGFDDNGLATERFVENKIGRRSTEMPRTEFVKTCLRETEDAEKLLKKSWQSLGLACDWTLNYRTIDEHCRRVSQRSFIELYNMGREYRKNSPTLWCPECRTAIAQVELTDKETESQFSEILFELEDGEKIHISTTRPEFLPACVAIFVNPEDSRHSALIGKKAKVPLFGYSVPIIGDAKADPEKGTGIVMCCTFGDQTDIEWWKKYELPLKIAINKDGTMSELAGVYKGLAIKEARKKIAEDLASNNLLVSQTPMKHTVNVHERCGTEIEFLVTEQWFVKYLDMKEQFIDAGRKILWHPEHMRASYENWINGLQWDWCISRQRYYGVPFPLWYCKKCGEIIIAEDKQLPVDPTESMPEKPCPKCGSAEFEPERDVFDTWATSSLTPEIMLKWKEDSSFFKKMYPMSLRAQGHDIINFWAFNTIVKGTLHTNEVPWIEIMINGWALDEHGRKMAKSKGNGIEPAEMMQKYSADALRFWAASAKLGDDICFSEKEFTVASRLMNKLWNASKFCIQHIAGYSPEKPQDFETIDAWLLSKLNCLVKACMAAFDNYDFVRVRLDAENFFWHEFCDEYLEMVKDRIYNPGSYTASEINSAKYAIYTAMLTMLKLFAPIMPHITEEIFSLHYSEKENARSIHAAGWPSADEKLISPDAEELGGIAIELVSEIRKFKSSKGMSLKTEISKLAVECDEAMQGKIRKVEQQIKATGKVKEISFEQNDGQLNQALAAKVKIEV